MQDFSQLTLRNRRAYEGVGECRVHLYAAVLALFDNVLDVLDGELGKQLNAG